MNMLIIPINNNSALLVRKVIIILIARDRSVSLAQRMDIVLVCIWGFKVSRIIIMRIINLLVL